MTYADLRWIVALAALAGLVFWPEIVKVWKRYREAQMEKRIRWYNRLAAWLHERLTDWLIPLALPAWTAWAEEDELVEREAAIYQSEIDAISQEAWDEGYEAAAREIDHERPY